MPPSPLAWARIQAARSSTYSDRCRGSILVGSLALATVTPRPAPEAEATFDHSLFDKILRENVSADGWVDYKNIRDNHAKDLERYLGKLAAATPPRLGSVKERMAFWINAYNAVCIKKLIDHEIPESVPKAVLFGTNIFKEVCITECKVVLLSGSQQTTICWVLSC